MRRLIDSLLMLASMLLLVLGTMLTLVVGGVVALLGLWFIDQILHPGPDYADLILPVLQLSNSGLPTNQNSKVTA